MTSHPQIQSIISYHRTRYISPTEITEIHPNSNDSKTKKL